MRRIVSLIVFVCCTLFLNAANPPLKGKVKVVKHHADYKVKVVDRFPDLKVKKVDFFADEVGEWTFVEHHADFTIQYVDYGEDFSIMFVNHFPGLPDGKSRLKGRQSSRLSTLLQMSFLSHCWRHSTYSFYSTLSCLRMIPVFL